MSGEHRGWKYKNSSGYKDPSHVEKGIRRYGAPVFGINRSVETRSQLPLEVAMARKAAITRRRGLMEKSVSYLDQKFSPKPSKQVNTASPISAKGRMMHKSRHKKAWYKATGQGNYGGYDKWGRSQ
tara:strand:+ start:43 stop:420 length:378 start_codon:yes stop_codon:yes gene_type:complete